MRFRTDKAFDLPGNALGNDDMFNSMAAAFFGATGKASVQATEQESRCKKVTMYVVIAMVVAYFLLAPMLE